MLRLADSWAWDFWLADDGQMFHLYFLKAPRALRDPDLRHLNVTIGHATSSDLVDWAEVADVLAPSPKPAFDDVATWTGSVTRAPDGGWLMFYTGCTRIAGALRQRVGVATSADLYEWHKHPASPVLESDDRWYEQAGLGQDEAWRDPWVFADPAGDGWHMLVTARANRGAADQRGVIGHARSPDLLRWQAQPPLSQPGLGFWHMEVQQVEVVEGRPVLVFSCLPEQVTGDRRGAGRRGGVWCAPGESVLGPFDLSQATPLTSEHLYSGRLIRDRAGQWVMLAFRDRDAQGRFGGEISGPVAVGWNADGTHLIAGPRSGEAAGEHGGHAPAPLGGAGAGGWGEQP